MSELLTDSWTVMQKEMRELLSARGAASIGTLLIGSVVLLLGILLPVVVGPTWLQQEWLMTLWAWLPVFLVATLVADSIAGERERHTLETLLASGLSDRAIVLGKVGAALLFGWGLMFITLFVSLAAINIVYARDQLLVYEPLLLIGGGLLSLLASVLAASFGVLVSLRASSLRRAQVIIVVTLLVLLAAQVVGLPLLRLLLPDGWLEAGSSLSLAFQSVGYVGGLALALTVMNAVLIAVAWASFQRHRLRLN